MKILISQWQKADSFFTKWFGNDGYLFSLQTKLSLVFKITSLILFIILALTLENSFCCFQICYSLIEYIIEKIKHTYSPQIIVMMSEIEPILIFSHILRYTDYKSDFFSYNNFLSHFIYQKACNGIIILLLHLKDQMID